MISRGRPVARLVIWTGFLFAVMPALAAPRTAISAAKGATPVSRIDALRPPEVRLRKLHLVRPDLIPYPIAYEVVC